ncbi:hypothetical protein E4T80_05610 [Muribacter muris]|uniref:Type II secretory pathway, component PulJ n=1 Tax=Muribacter muris TaxID=67855 RepID=A0A4Y9JYC5_9PAST|nr:hypothetical protein [Muribacter muris]MBF0784945.1 hypothetical protein [Muribacter muris]MBF0827253.1 hypothetical protein [Muribacter muris]TFV10864.1 hypothetical protein E4T80_05610 [Muribacter muris]
MWYRKISVPNAVNLNAAFSLVEILIALSLGTLVLLSAIKFYADQFIHQNTQRELFQLQRHAHQLLEYLQHHIQHIGYQGKNRKSHNFNLFIPTQAYSLNNAQCFIFIYDLNGDGCIGSRSKNNACRLQNRNNTKAVAKEIFGFKLENKKLTILDDDKHIRSCYQNECLSILKNCHKFKWSKLSDLSEYHIEKLQFSWVKEGILLKVEIMVSSYKDRNKQYSATIYSYIFNAREG